MRVAITNPTTWPYVRRGAERFINELARYLAGRGHGVTVISGKPGPTEVIRGEGYSTICHRRLWHPCLAEVGLLEFHMFFFPCLASLLRERYDAVVCLTFMDAFAAQVARRFTKSPYVFLVNGIPPRKQYFRSLTLKGSVFGRAVRSGDSIIAISNYVREYLEGRWGRRCDSLPIPLDTDKFRPRQKIGDGPPKILCAAALQDARKGGRVLMDAFGLLKQSRPDAILQLASPLPASTSEALLARIPPALRRDVQFLQDAQDLPELYAQATVSVLPSLWEPYGMVVLESMAAGTPVVGTRDGAIPELISDSRLGRLFDPGEGADVEPVNAAGLAQALDECIGLAGDPATSERCRMHALKYSWRAVGPKYEGLLAELAAGCPVAPEIMECS
jgi:phosphatidyl-myo-inositol alpha-mannosyltransferase